ncbi:MAG: hypothetical protein IJ685_05235 [Selenomonadaceae bacterium]|nr:hypothetical protein [Selenomonadaceae bacterium]
MKNLDLMLLLSLFAAFLLSTGSFVRGDLETGLCGLSLAILLTAMNTVNFLIDIRNELRRRRYELGHG